MWLHSFEVCTIQRVPNASGSAIESGDALRAYSPLVRKAPLPLDAREGLASAPATAANAGFIASGELRPAGRSRSGHTRRSKVSFRWPKLNGFASSALKPAAVYLHSGDVCVGGGRVCRAMHVTLPTTTASRDYAWRLDRRTHTGTDTPILS